MNDYMQDTIKVKDKEFKLYLSQVEIQQIVKELAKEISEDLKDENPLMLPVLNGSFIFASDLLREMDIDAEVSFIKMASYSGTQSTGNAKQLIGLNEDISGRTIVLIEDIIDTGISMEILLNQLRQYNPKMILICTLLFKPGKFQKDYSIHYIGKQIEDEFIVGYGLDYDGLGRKYSEIYQLK